MWKSEYKITYFRQFLIHDFDVKKKSFIRNHIFNWFWMREVCYPYWNHQSLLEQSHVTIAFLIAFKVATVFNYNYVATVLHYHFFILFLLRACDISKISKFYWFVISTCLCLKYIKFSFQNLGNSIEDKKTGVNRLLLVSKLKKS